MPTDWIDVPGYNPSGWDYPVASTIALIISSFGIEGLLDIYYATACHLIYWFWGYKGPDAIYNALSGLQAGRGKWLFAAFPTMLDTYEGINELRKKNGLTPKTLIRTGSWSLGFWLGRKKYL